MKQFSELGVKPELVAALNKMNFIQATDVQERTIPVVLQGKDVIVRAKTGTGKTYAYLIPIAQKIIRGAGPAALVIAPTRELALQISEVASKLMPAQGVVTVYGAASINAQLEKLHRHPSMVVGTPGRILDFIERGALNLHNIRFMVLDEADMMLDMGFIDDIERILSSTPDSRETMLFSATMPDRIIDIARKHMQSPTYIQVGREDELVVTSITHFYAVCDNRMKFATLFAYIKYYKPSKAIIFAQTKYAADEIHDALTKNGVEALLMHGNITQANREASIRAFKGAGRFLIATNIASRGLDINGVSDIINFDVPEDPYVYVHRVGRSARMNADGRAFNLVRKDQLNIIKDIEYVTNIKMRKLEIDARDFKYIQIFKRRVRPPNTKGINKRSFSRNKARGSPYGRYNPNRH